MERCVQERFVELICVSRVDMKMSASTCVWENNEVEPLVCSVGNWYGILEICRILIYDLLKNVGIVGWYATHVM